MFGVAEAILEDSKVPSLPICCPCLLLFSCFLWSSKKWPKQFAVANNIIVRQSDRAECQENLIFLSSHTTTWVLSAQLGRIWDFGLFWQKNETKRCCTKKVLAPKFICTKKKCGFQNIYPIFFMVRLRTILNLVFGSVGGLVGFNTNFNTSSKRPSL